MHDILGGSDGALYLVDDVSIYGVHQAQHDARFRTVLDRLNRADVMLNDKCEFSGLKLTWARYIISSYGIQVDPDRVKAIVNMQLPTNVRGSMLSGDGKSACQIRRRLGGTISTDPGPASQGWSVGLGRRPSEVFRCSQAGNYHSSGIGALRRCQIDNRLSRQFFL
jgi:hypothetical protein